MAFELEALVGYVFIVGGRVIKTTPPGALCEVAPKKSARGRETDTFFALVVPSGANAPVTFYEQMSTLAAERYFGTSGSVTSALRETLNTLNNNLFEHNASGRKPYEASIVTAVLRGEELYIARVGSAAAVLRHNGETLTLPETLADEEALFQPPLGVRPIPEVLLKRFSVNSGTRLLLTDANVAELKLDNITQAMTAANLEVALDDYRTMVTSQMQAMLIELVPPEVSAPMPVVVGESSKAITAELASAKPAPSKPTPTPETPAKPKRANPVLLAIKRVIGGMAWVLGSFFTAIGQLLGRLLGRSVDAPAVRYSAGVLSGLVFLLPLMVVMVVVVAWAAGIGETRFEECARQANDAATIARNLGAGSPTSLLAAWRATQLKVNECDSLRPDDPAIVALKRETLQVLDRLQNVERRNLVTLSVVPNANFKTLILRGLDMYALDSTNSIVYRLTLSADGMSLATTPQPLINLRRGAGVSGFTVGNILDIGYDDQLNTVVALDANGVLVRCPPRFMTQCDAQRVQASETWRKPIGITLWQGTLYVLDIGSNQLWRYTSSGGNYAGVPTEYFSGAVRPDLSNAVDFAISTAGNTRGSVYTLYSNGVLTRHFGGEPQSFGFAGFPEGQDLANDSLSGMFLNDSPIDTAFFLISPATRTIYETSIAGSFIASYRVEQEDALAFLSDVVAEPSQQVVYLASGNGIFAFKK